jgi:hypothetical protein
VSSLTPEQAKKGGQKSAATSMVAAASRRAAFVATYADLLDIERTCTRIGVKRSTYRFWRHKHPEFAQAIDEITATSKASATPGTSQWDLSVQSFVDFRRLFFGMDTPEFQRRMVDALIEMATAEQKGQITMILVPPEHGKTTLLEDFVTFLVAIDSNRRITVISERQRHALKFSTRVRSRLEARGPYPELVKTFGPFEPQGREQAWGTDFWTIRSAKVHDERDYTMATGGWKAAIAGTRATDLFIDDIMSLRNLTQARQVLEVFRQDMLSRPGVNGNTCIVGTRVGNDDFYELLEATGIVDHVIRFPAIDDNGNYLWPERYSPEDYRRLRRNAGDEAWWRNYQQKPLLAGDSTFDDDAIEKMKRHFLSKSDALIDGHPLYISVDPAFGGNCVVTCAQHIPHALRLIDQRMESSLSKTETIISMIATMLMQYVDHSRHIGCTDIVIEDNAAQKGLANDDRLLEIADRYGANVVSHTTGHNKYDENIGVPQMAASARRNEIEVPYAEDEVTQFTFDPFFAECRSWRPRIKGTVLRQDRVMGLWFIWILFRQRTWWDDVDTEDDWGYSAPGSEGLFEGLGVALR